MKADSSQKTEIGQQLKELETLIEFFKQERTIWPISGVLPEDGYGKNGRHDLKVLQEFLQKYTLMVKQFQELRLNLSLALPHELRTPLNAILGFSQYLMSQTPQELHHSDAIFHIYSSIYESALRMHHLVENYLLYAKLQMMVNGPETATCEHWQQHEDVNTMHLLHCTARIYAERAGRKEDVHLELDHATLRISRQCLQKILEELLDNAFKFSEPGTTVAITTTITDQEWSLRIADQGRGMSPEQIEQIGAYMQFERLQYAQQGAGLGLAIVQLLVQLRGGNLAIESVPQQGTTVTISFPQQIP